MSRSGFKSLAAHHAGVKATGRPRELKPRGMCVRIAPSALIRDRLMAGRRPLKPSTLVRPQLPEPCLCSSPGQSAAPVRRRQSVRGGPEAQCARRETVYALARGASGPQGSWRFKSSRAHHMPPWRNRQRSRFVSGRFPVRVREEALDGEWGNRQPDSLLKLLSARPNRASPVHAFVALAVRASPR